MKDMFIDTHIVTNQPPSVKGVTTNSLPQGEPFIDVIQASFPEFELGPQGLDWVEKHS